MTVSIDSNTKRIEHVDRHKLLIRLAIAASCLCISCARNCLFAQTAAAPALTPAAAPPTDINASFLDPELDPQEFVKRFEIESREVYAARQAILRACSAKAGETVADVGAGTGLFTALFAHEVQPGGWVYAVDIAPRFLEHISARATEAGLTNITPVLCTRSSVNLAPASINMAFVCDTYHHFEHPAHTLASIHAALRPGGRLVIVDFIREEGISSDWVLGHVRAGKNLVIDEIKSAGFELLAEPNVAGLSENYFLVFRKE